MPLFIQIIKETVICMSIIQNKQRKRAKDNKVTRIDKRKWFLYILLLFVIVLPYLGLWFCKVWYNKKVKEIENASIIIVNKDDMSLKLIDYKGKALLSYGIACGKKYGNKTIRGDFKTPEGIFHISDIQDASTWKHDFGDGKGEIPQAYGPYFLRLEVPGHKGIGIHGTHKPESIGTRDTEGCIRLRNEDLLELKKHAYIGMTVVVLPSLTDMVNNNLLDSLRQEIKQTEIKQIPKKTIKQDRVKKEKVESRKSKIIVKQN